jgi:hypothetical protein
VVKRQRTQPLFPDTEWAESLPNEHDYSGGRGEKRKPAALARNREPARSMDEYRLWLKALSDPLVAEFAFMPVSRK